MSVGHPDAILATGGGGQLGHHLARSAGARAGARVVALGRRELDLTDPYDNVTAGVAFLDYLHDVTGGDIRLILGGYYQGLRSIDRNGFYRDTEQYIDNVLALRDRY